MPRPRGRPIKLRMDAEVNASISMGPFDFKNHVKQEPESTLRLMPMVPPGFPMDKVMKHVKQPLKSEEEQVAADSNHSKIQWAWKRQSFQGKKAKVDLYVHFKFLDQVKIQLTDIDRPKMYEDFASSCFGPFLHFSTEGNISYTALHALLGREVTRSDSEGKDEFWFQIGGRLARFSKYEFALVTGLRFGNSGFNPNAQHVIPSNGVYARRVASAHGRVFVSDIYKRFVRSEFADSVADQVKIAKILFVYKILFGVTTHSTSVSDWVWALIEDDEAWESFPWGKFTYQVLSHRLRRLPMSQPENRIFRYTFQGFSTALLIWAYEAIPQLGSICGDRIGEEDLQRPRLIRWRMNRKMIMDVTDFFDKELECHERLEPSVEELKYFARHCVDDDLGAGIQYVHRDSSTFVRRRVDNGGSGRAVSSLVGRWRRHRRHARCSRRAPLRGGARDEVDPPTQVKRARVVLQEDKGTSNLSSDLLQRIMVMFTNDVERVVDKIERFEMLALGRLGGLEKRVDVLERSLERSKSVVEDKSAAGNYTTDEGPKNNSPENIVATESVINSVDENGLKYIPPDQTVEETHDAVRRNETTISPRDAVIRRNEPTISRPPRGRLPCYGWIESDGEDEDDFVILKPAHAVTGRGKRKSRWDVKPDDPY
ncbi:hypothetical protein CASFOL_003167 [Castilleja foliolosa]|uniref:DUF1985 domain-containing protein n=1 Tax=Castilleja foliolosa TaxID=1961234 RepID=A0ABD3EJS3_9LAMI